MDQRPGRVRFSTGEFAKLANVPKQTLQFYDRIGLFSPSIRSDNGYRYYEAEQYDALDIIYALKETGMPLSEIKSYLENRTPHSCLDLIESESTRIKKKIRSLERIHDIMIQKKSAIMKAMSTETSTHIEIKELSGSHLFTWDFTHIDMEHFMVELIRMVNWCYDHGYYSGYPMGSIVLKSDLLKNDFSKLSHLYMIMDSVIDHPNYRYRPGGIYAIYNYKGSYDDLSSAYSGIIEDLENEGWLIDGDSYETGLLDYFSVSDPSAYLIEIAIPVRRP